MPKAHATVLPNYPYAHNDTRNSANPQPKTIDDGDVWLDTGTIDSLSDATDYVRVMQKRTGQIIGSPEKIAYEQGFITADQLAALAESLKKSGYSSYLVCSGCLSLTKI